MMDHGIFIIQGEYAVSDDRDTTISTLLGSCVACCLWDPLAGVGGMNHMLIASQAKDDAKCEAAGVQAMELLINALVQRGAKRSRLRAKAFGGARMVRGLSDVGAANCAFTLDYLQREQIPCISHSLGGNFARQVRFLPVSGIARQKIVRELNVPVDPDIYSEDAKGYGIEEVL